MYVYVHVENNLEYITDVLIVTLEDELYRFSSFGLNYFKIFLMMYLINTTWVS